MFVVKLMVRTSSGQTRGHAAVRGRDLLARSHTKVVVTGMLSASVCGGDGDGMGASGRSRSQHADGENHDASWKADGEIGKRHGYGR